MGILSSPSGGSGGSERSTCKSEPATSEHDPHKSALSFSPSISSRCSGQFSGLTSPALPNAVHFGPNDVSAIVPLTLPGKICQRRVHREPHQQSLVVQFESAVTRLSFSLQGKETYGHALRRAVKVVNQAAAALLLKKTAREDVLPTRGVRPLGSDLGWNPRYLQPAPGLRGFTAQRHSSSRRAPAARFRTESSLICWLWKSCV